MCFTTEDTLKKVAFYLEEYQNYIKSLKKEGYNVIGYARKPKGNETEELLQLMCNCLRDSLLVDTIFVSYICTASDTLHLRDKHQEKALEDGNTQGKNNWFKKHSELTCFVI